MKKRDDLVVMIVEDHLGMRRIIRTVLTSLNIKYVVEAGDGAQALEILKERNRGLASDITGRQTKSGEKRAIDLIIADWSMPVMSGVKLLGIVRKDQHWNSLPFVMITAENSREQIVEAVNLGVSDYIIKPFTTSVLEAKLKSLFEDRFN